MKTITKLFQKHSDLLIVLAAVLLYGYFSATVDTTVVPRSEESVSIQRDNIMESWLFENEKDHCKTSNAVYTLRSNGMPESGMSFVKCNAAKS
jgi:hypothetical protein